MTTPERPDGRHLRGARHRVERRAALLSAAADALAHAPAGAGLDHVATTSGVARSVWYRYFGDLTGLLQALATARVARTRQEVVALEATAADPLLAALEAHVAEAVRAPGLYRALVDVRPLGEGPLVDLCEALDGGEWPRSRRLAVAGAVRGATSGAVDFDTSPTDAAADVARLLRLGAFAQERMQDLPPGL